VSVIYTQNCPNSSGPNYPTIYSINCKLSISVKVTQSHC